LIKRLLKKSYTAHIGWYVWKNVRRSAHARRHGRIATGGAYSSRSPLEAAQRALKWGAGFRDRISPDRLRRLDSVVELGVGDSLAMAILWIGFGAKKVSGLDAFGDPRNLRHEKAVVESLLTLLPADECRRIRDVVDLGQETLLVDPGRVTYLENIPCERILEKIPAGSVDVVYSLALLEHVRDLGRTLRAVYATLSPQGEMIHRVDLRNHGVLAEFGDQAFLRPSPLVWRLMGGDKGLHNRKRLGFYREVLEDCGARVSIESDVQYEVNTPEGRTGESSSRVRVFWLAAKRPALPDAFRGAAEAKTGGRAASQ
jgi:SAM-dependent methyltransferase